MRRRVRWQRGGWRWRACGGAWAWRRGGCGRGGARRSSPCTCGTPGPASPFSSPTATPPTSARCMGSSSSSAHDSTSTSWGKWWSARCCVIDWFLRCFWLGWATKITALLLVIILDTGWMMILWKERLFFFSVENKWSVKTDRDTFFFFFFVFERTNIFFFSRRPQPTIWSYHGLIL